MGCAGPLTFRLSPARKGNTVPGRRRRNPAQLDEQWDLFALLAEQTDTAEGNETALTADTGTGPAVIPPESPPQVIPPESPRSADPGALFTTAGDPAITESHPAPTAVRVEPAGSAALAVVDIAPPAAEPPAPQPDQVDPVDYRHPGAITVPSGTTRRANANLAALRTLRALTDQSRPATPDEQAVLAGWSGWGALPHVFDAPADHDGDRYWPHRYAELIPDRLARYRHAHRDTSAATVEQAARALQELSPDQPTTAVATQLRDIAGGLVSLGQDSPAGRAADELADRLTQVAAVAEWDPIRADLNQITTVRERIAAARSTLNAHYTDPAVIVPIWDALSRLGFTGGPVLEPGCGSGSFIGLAPADARMIGVELDPVTARIAQALYPSADIVNAGFEGPGWTDGAFAATVGNVPFGNFKLYDPAFNGRGHSIHNHFLLKAIQLTAPGGIVAAITSAYTMDAAGSAARREMHHHADLVGAIRLPAATFRAVAGTDVTTDLMILRRRMNGEVPQPFSTWETAVDVDTPAGTVSVNRWFVDHPDMIIGTLTAGRSPYRDAATTVTAPAGTDIPTELSTRLDQVVTRAQNLGLTWSVADVDALPQPRDPDAGTWEAEAKPGSVRAEPDGTFTRLDPATRTWRPHKVSQAHRGETRALLGLRDSVADLIAAQQIGADPEQRQTARAATRQLYDAYTAAYGAINRFTLKDTTSWVQVGNIDPEDVDPDWETRHAGAHLGKPQFTADGDPVIQVQRHWLTQQRPPAVEALRTDPGFAAVLALELFDEDTQTATPAPILDHDVLVLRQRPMAVPSAADALAIVLDETGHVDLGRIADLIEGSPSPDQARQLLGTLVFDDPDTGQLVPAAQYLSGHVRSKLAAARAAATGDPKFQANVNALTAVVPADLGPADIEAGPGVTWVPPADYQAFIDEVLESPEATVAWEPLTGTWDVAATRRHSRPVRHTYGVEGHDGIDLLTSLMNNTPVLITKLSVDWDGRERQVPDPDATEAANAKRTALADRFATWLWTDDDRAARLGTVYNDRFNSWAAPAYDGSHLSLPGLGATYDPRPTQTAAVARIVDQPTVLLDHVVGAGKTGTMIMAAMELRRLGHARQPWIVVPNHIVEQVAREAKQWYPGASILAGTPGTNPQTRREFVALTATGDYDMVIVPESTFVGIPVSPDTQADFIAGRVQELTQALAQRSDTDDGRGRGSTTKRLEAAKIRLETRLASLRAEGRAGSDTGLNFETSGCDYLFVDEAHYYKNAQVISSTRDLARDKDSQRALDLSVKMRVLRQQRAAEGRSERIATFATGTPIPNSPREMWVMLNYLRPDLLAHAAVDTFDAWAANHLRPQTRLEMKPTGSGFQPKTRITQFVNVPEMSQMWRQMADLVTRADLDVSLPTLTGGGRQTVALDRTDAQADYAAVLEARAAAVKLGMVDPKDDNMLAITGDGRKAALDPRLVGLPVSDDGGRPTAVVEQIMRIHHATGGNRYLDDNKEPHPRPGGLQVVFLDQSTPKPGQWTMYRQIKDELVAAGLHPDQVRFIHDAPPGPARTELFAACRDGRVSVLIGSTAKLGTGANIQSRLTALHHVDVPWRPADLEQREGRILRPGNQNTDVEIWTYVTENSFDAFSWNLVAVKANFIAQIKNGTTSRHVDADDSDAVSFDLIAAISSGDPRIMERYQLGIDLQALERLERAHHTEQRSLHGELRGIAATTAALHDAINLGEQAHRATTPTAGDAFGISIDGRHFTERADAGRALFHLLAARTITGKVTRSTDEIIAQLGGHDVRMRSFQGGDTITLSFPAFTDPAGYLDSYTRVYLGDLSGTNPGLGLIRRLENTLADLPHDVDQLRARVRELPGRITELEQLVGAPFDRADDLAGIRTRIRTLDAELADPEPAGQLDPPPPPWLQQLPPGQQDGLLWGPRLRRVHPDSTLPVKELKVGDILAGTEPRRITAITGWSTRQITTEPLTSSPDNDATKDLSKRGDTTVGVVARDRSQLPDIYLAIADSDPADKVIPLDDITAGHTITAALSPVNARGQVEYQTAQVRTLTVADVVDAGSVNRGNPAGRVLTDQDGRRWHIQDTAEHNRVLHHPDRPTPDAHQPSAAPPVIPVESPAPVVSNPTETAPAGATTAGPSAEVIPLESPDQPRPALDTPDDPEGPILRHSPAGTVVTGTDRGDTALRAALKQHGFKWSGAQHFWYLPRNLRPHTRAVKVEQLVAHLGRHGRNLPVITTTSEQTTTTGPARPTTPHSGATLTHHAHEPTSAPRIGLA